MLLKILTRITLDELTTYIRSVKHTAMGQFQPMEPFHLASWVTGRLLKVGMILKWSKLNLQNWKIIVGGLNATIGGTNTCDNEDVITEIRINSPATLYDKKWNEGGCCLLNFIVEQNVRMLHEWSSKRLGTFTFVKAKEASMVCYIVIELLMWHKYKSFNILPHMESEHFLLFKNSFRLLWEPSPRTLHLAPN